MTVFATFPNGIDNQTGPLIARARPILGFAIDLGNNKLWVRLSSDSTGNWNNSGTANPSTNVGGFDIASVNNGVSVVPAFSGFFGGIADIGILNAGATTFWMSIPSGYTAWDTTGATTWNPADNSTLTLSNGNLKASAQTTASTWRSIRAIGSAKTTGKWYFEIAADQVDSSNGWMGGVANASATLTNFVGSDNNALGIQANGSMWKNSASTAGSAGTFLFSTWRTALATNISRHTGKWYFEGVCDAIGTSNAWMLGVGNASTLLTNFAGTTTNSAAYQGFTGSEHFWINNGQTSVGLTVLAATQTLGIAVDLDNNRMWCNINGGAWSNSGNPSTNTGGNDISTVNNGSSVMIAWSGFGQSGVPEQVTLIPGDTKFSPPSGFLNWDFPTVLMGRHYLLNAQVRARR